MSSIETLVEEIGKLTLTEASELVTLIVAVVVVGAVVLGTRMGWVTVSFEKAEQAPITDSSKKA